MFIRVLLFGILGTIAALFISAVKRSIAHRRLELIGEASLLYLPLFGLIALLFPIIAIHVSSLPWYGRGGIYMLALYILQYAVGLLLTRFNICPWHYSGKGSLSGIVHIADAPVWFAAGLAIEYAYPWIKATAVALS